MLRGSTLTGFVTVACVVALGAPVAVAAPTQIEFGGSSFTPNDVTVSFIPGENTVEWNRNEPVAKTYHSITSNGGSFGIGPGGFSDFDLRMSAGTYPYYCVNHGSGGAGMVGVVAVRPTLTGGDNDTYDVIWADDETQTGGDFSARWKKQGQDRWKRWSFHFEATGRAFGQNDNPVDVKPNKTYLLQIRSSGPGTSQWSPTLKLKQAT